MTEYSAIDTHTHILPKTWPDLARKYGYGGFIKLEHTSPCCANMLQDDKVFRKVNSNCWDLEVRLAECAEHNIAKQVLMTIPVMFNYWAKANDCAQICRFLNAHIAECIALYPKNFLGLGSIPMQDTEHAIVELNYCKSIGLHGVQIGTHINDKNLDAPEFLPIFSAAQDLNMAIFVHPWDMLAKNRMQKYWLPWLVGMPTETSLAICSLIFSGVLAKLPKLRIAFAHGGGAFLATLGRISHGYKMRPDLCATDCAITPEKFLQQIYFDTLVHDEDSLNFLLKKASSDNLMLGSDYPFPLGELTPGKLIYDSSIATNVKRKLLCHNAQRWLGIHKHEEAAASAS